MSTAIYHIGDTRDIVATLETGSIDLVLTSPPFLALRSYLPDGHPDKDREIGSEPTPAEFVDTLLDLTAEWRRVLAPHGSIAVELGDTYSSSGGTTDNRENSLGGNDQAPRPDRGGGDGWPLAKSLTLIPELFRIALVYGINPLTGNESPAGQWRVRNVVRWVRPNPPVGALGDKYRPATSVMVIACISDKRWFDLDAVRTPFSPNSATPHRIYEISWDLTFFGWGPGDTLSFAMGVEDGPTSTFSEWPIWADGVDVCWHDYGDLILASPPVPNVPALSLWGTVGMTGAMAAFVTWRLRRRTAAL